MTLEPVFPSVASDRLASSFDGLCEVSSLFVFKEKPSAVFAV